MCVNVPGDELVLSVSISWPFVGVESAARRTGPSCHPALQFSTQVKWEDSKSSRSGWLPVSAPPPSRILTPSIGNNNVTIITVYGIKY